ncbi:MAG: molecular chaperone DnaJ, partial [Clostridiales bacterium]|nr:molecular chaperone DnaJ [Clostridiales bacterium]
MADKKDFYEILGLGKNADEIEIKKAYRKLAKQHHPDVNSGEKVAETKFKEINEAYQILSDPEKKARYDKYGHAGVDPNNAGFNGFGGFGDMDFGLGDIFESFFGGGRSKRNGPQKGADLKHVAEISFEEAAFGVQRDINLYRMENCDSCGGTGAKAGSQPVQCKHCGGTGQVSQRSSTAFGQFVNVKSCDVCSGEGKIIIDPCQNCHGKGHIKKSRKINVNIPAGIDDGQTISLRGEGEPGIRSGPSGDLYINVRVAPHVLFSRQGNDIICEVPITYPQSVLGAEIEVPTLDGKVKYNIPEGTQTGSVFRIKNKGVPFIRGNGRGDHYIKINVEIPKKLTHKQKELLRQFSEAVGEEHHEQRKS